MKNTQQTFKRWAGMVGMICLLALVFTSCLKHNTNDDTVVPVALLSVINLSPGSQPVDIYLDNNKANNNAFGFADGLDYIRAYTGKRTAKFVVSATQATIKSDTMTLRADRAYTLFLANLPANPQFVLLNDTLSQPATDKAAIRFINMGPDAPAVDLVTSTGTVITSNKAFKGVSSFIPVAGNTTVNLEIRRTGTTTVLASLSNVNIRNGSLYTVWLQGLSAATDQTKLAANIQLNAYY